MVAATANLPNLRKLFVPDPDFTMIEADLAKADAQVVAWDAGAERLKQMFKEGVNIHEENAIDIFNCKRKDVKVGGSESPYQKAKIGVHAVDYACQAGTLAAHIGTTVHEAELFMKRWFAMNPEILQWHNRVMADLTVSRMAKNKFGFRILYLDQINRKTLGEALAWIASSTVSVVINKGLVNVHANVPEVQLLLQVHDSLLMQTPNENVPSIYSRIHENMLIPVPYDDPLIIPVDIAVSDVSWGHVKEIELAA